ncbi:hypothetical protein PGH45_20045 [Legionella pneumophila]|nr:hypothetical protein [Legionella pneumophila]
MRDNKVMTWAGVSGALSGIASAAQYAQSVQAIGPYGATSVVPSSELHPLQLMVVLPKQLTPYLSTMSNEQNNTIR